MNCGCLPLRGVMEVPGMEDGANPDTGVVGNVFMITPPDGPPIFWMVVVDVNPPPPAGDLVARICGLTGVLGVMMGDEVEILVAVVPVSLGVVGGCWPTKAGFWNWVC